MSREWKPGDVVVVLATFGPKDNAPSEYVASRNADGWTLLAHRAEYWLDGNDDYDCKPVRPLVVIDPEDREAVERLIGAVHHVEPHGIEPHDIDEMQAALREYANPKPPKPDEPQGLGAVVEDEDGYLYVRGYVNGESTHEWHVIDPASNKRMGWWKYDEIAAVRVLSPGVVVDQ